MDSTSELNKYVVSVHGDQVTFTNEVWAAISDLIIGAHKCQGCKKDLNYCENCERLLQT